MRVYVISLLLLPALAIAQQPNQPQPPAGSNWQHVQALPLGVPIRVATQHRSESCALKSVDADSLTCLHGKEITFQRTEILYITIPRRGASTGIMAAVGAGVGVAVTKIVAASVFKSGAKGAVYVGGAAVGAVMFAGIGAIAQPVQSTVYKAH